VDQVNYTAQKAWKALHFVMRVLKKRKQEYKTFSLHAIGTSYSWNIGLHAGIHAEKDK